MNIIGDVFEHMDAGIEAAVQRPTKMPVAAGPVVGPVLKVGLPSIPCHAPLTWHFDEVGEWPSLSTRKEQFHELEVIRDFRLIAQA